MTPLETLLERAEAIYLVHGTSSATFLKDQIETAIRAGESARYIQDLDHVLQLVEYRDRTLALYGRR
ncbi:hypothetical protein ACX40Y_09235 [Sphingomonas sp. RS6]